MSDKQMTLFITAIIFVVLLTLVNGVGVVAGKQIAYDNCVSFNSDMTVDAARVLCRKTVYEGTGK